MQVAKADNQKHLINGSGNTTDIIAAILHADKLCASYTTNLAKTLSKKTVKDTCQAIYSFVTDNIEYKEDPDGLQFIQSPGHLFWGADGKGNGTGDCKSMSIFCASVLQNLGIKYAYRFISESAKNDFHHVFIVVPDEKGETVILDCVDDAFNIPHNFAKVKDIAAGPTAAAGKIAGFGDVVNGTNDGSTAPSIQNTYGFNVASWDEFLTEWKKQILPQEKTLRLEAAQKIVKDTPFVGIDFGANSQRREKFKKFFDNTCTISYQLLYSYWDESQSTFPVEIKGKKQQAIDLKNEILADTYNNRVKPDGSTFGTPIFTESTLYIWADISCYRTYGYPIPMLLQKGYNKINLGTDSLPKQGGPYFDLKQNKWVPNGMPAGDFSFLDGCLPYDGIRFYPLGTPYYSAAGFLMKNRATDATIKKWLTTNPMPQLMADAIKTDYATTNDYLQSEAYFNQWFEDRVLVNLFGLPTPQIKKGFGFSVNNPAPAKGFGGAITTGTNVAQGFLPKPTINPQNTLNYIRNHGGIQSHAVKGKAKIGLADAVIGAIVSAVIGAVVAIITLVVNYLKDKNNKYNSATVQGNISNYPTDIANSYQTADGCYMEAHNINGQIVYKKLCPDGTVTQGANPNAPENTPAYAPGILGDPNTTEGKLKRVLVGAAIAFGVYKIIS